jgi:hypothetical protein
MEKSTSQMPIQKLSMLSTSQPVFGNAKSKRFVTALHIIHNAEQGQSR